MKNRVTNGNNKESNILKRFWKKNKNRRITYLICVLLLVFIINTPITLALRGLIVSTVDYVVGKSLYINLSKTQESANEKALATVPEWAKDLFLSQGGTIIIVDELDCTASYSHATKVIKVKDTGFMKNTSIPHEIGHCIDHTLGEVSATEEFIRVAEEEIDDFTDSKALIQLNHDYLESSQAETGKYSEYFAEAFGTYCMEPLLLKATAPKTYDYMKEFCER